jgi:hypothetical protein
LTGREHGTRSTAGDNGHDGVFPAFDVGAEDEAALVVFAEERFAFREARLCVYRVRMQESRSRYGGIEFPVCIG